MRTILLFFLLLGFLPVGKAQDQHSLRFNGTSGQLTLCDTDGLNIGEAFTLETWVFSPAWRAEFWQGSVINKEGPAPDSGYGLRIGKGGTINFVMNVDGVWFETTTPPLMNTNQWYHVAVTISEKTVTIYLNGTAEISNTFTGNVRNSPRPLTIGASPGFPGRIFNGNIDEVRIWNYARSATEIQANLTASFSGTEEGLVTYLPFSEGSGTATANLADADCVPTFNGLTADAWSDGYTLPKLDVGVSAITAPDVVALYGRPVKTTVELSNYGSETVTEIPVQLSVNGTPTLTGTFSGQIAPGETALFTFEQPQQLADNATNLIAASTQHADDPIAINNTATLRYRKPSVSSNGHPMISIFAGEQHNFAAAGQSRTRKVNLPADLSGYGQLRLHLGTRCPTTGCDPWDQTGNISIITPAGEQEIARFVTPYRIACGGEEWIVDVTDFKDMLQGEIVFKSFIQVFGASGWLLDAELELIPADVAVFQKTTPLWADQYLVYGDPARSHDLAPLAVRLAATTTDSRFRITISGHGQGNTDNAAEFSDRTHTFLLNNERFADHRLWKSDCEFNQCANQFGTWLFDRAGWCPGQAVQPWRVELSSDLAGQEVSFDYALQDYVNLRNTGYNNNGHTEPFYRIAAYLVEESETPYEAYANMTADSVVIEVAGEIDNPTGDEVTLYATNTGTETLTGGTVALYAAGNLLAEEVFTEAVAPGAAFAHRFTAGTGFSDYEDVQLIARISPNGDENESDDATDRTQTVFLVRTENVRQAGVALYPNPANGQLTLELTPAFLGGQIDVMDVTGRVLQTVAMRQLRDQLLLRHTGLMVLRFTTPSGATYYQKVVNQLN